MSARSRGGLAALCLLALSGCDRPLDTADAATPTPIACPQAAPDSGATTAVVKAARAFAATLEPRQREALVKPLTLANAIRWSNFPAALVPRAGVPFGDMNAVQTAAATALIQTAAGACGATLFAENRLADVVGHTALPQVGPEHHYISINGEPSETSPWMLMIGGHHIAFNFVFNTGEPGATPLFAGSDPARFTDAHGVAHYPMSRQGAALADMAQAVAKYPEAHLPGVYTDLVRSVIGFGGLALPNGERRPGGPGVGAVPAPEPGPGGGQGGNPFAAPGFGIDSKYPLDYPTGPSGRGVPYSRLSRAEQALVRNAIEAYAALPGRRISAPLLALYERPEQLADTYVALSGDPKLVAPNAYVRIDGPRVWIEMSVQPSLVDPKATHFHSVWRDKRSDYGGRFRG